MSTHNRVQRLVVGFLLLATLAYAQSAGPVFPDPGKTPMSHDNQQAVGMEVASQVYQQMPVLPDSSPESQYVRQLGNKLVATIPPQYSWPFEFHVIPRGDINAFAVPGGQMFINIGTLVAARNEAELAGVMAHEIAHVYMQHSAKQVGRVQTTSMLAGIASATLGGAAGEMVKHLGQIGIQMGAQGLVTNYSRSNESQADAVGAVILYKAGFNPQSMVDFFKMMGAQAGATPPELFSSHPNPGNRQEAIKKEIANWPAENYLASSPAFDAAHQHAMGVKTYSAQEIQASAKSGQWAALNERSGAALDPGGESSLATAPPPSKVGPVELQSVTPSQRMVADNLGSMKIHRPKNWKLTMPEQQGQFVTIAPHAGVTHYGVGYGVLLNGVAPPQGRQTSLDDITAQIIKRMAQNPGLKQMGQAQPITVGGIQSRMVVLQSPSPFPNAKGQPQEERDWLVTVPQQNGSVIFMIFVAPEDEFARFRPTYQAMLKSVQFR